jgi:hypothetical protein
MEYTGDIYYVINNIKNHIILHDDSLLGIY